MVNVNKLTLRNFRPAQLNVSVNLPFLYSFSPFWLELPFCYNSPSQIRNFLLIMQEIFLSKGSVHCTVLKYSLGNMFCA